MHHKNQIIINLHNKHGDSAEEITAFVVECLKQYRETVSISSNDREILRHLEKKEF